MNTEAEWREQHRKWWNERTFPSPEFLISERAWIAAKRDDLKKFGAVETTIDPVVNKRNSEEPDE